MVRLSEICSIEYLIIQSVPIHCFTWCFVKQKVHFCFYLNVKCNV